MRNKSMNKNWVYCAEPTKTLRKKDWLIRRHSAVKRRLTFIECIQTHIIRVVAQTILQRHDRCWQTSPKCQDAHQTKVALTEPESQASSSSFHYALRLSKGGWMITWLWKGNAPIFCCLNHLESHPGQLNEIFKERIFRTRWCLPWILDILAIMTDSS